MLDEYEGVEVTPLDLSIADLYSIIPLCGII